MKKGLRTRLRLLEEAAKLIAERGIDKLTIRALAKAAKVSPGTVSEHFNRMDDFLYLIIQYVLTASMAELVGPGVNPDKLEGARAKVQLLPLENLRLFNRHPYFYSCLALSYHSMKHDHRLATLHRQNYDRTVTQVQGFLVDLAKECRFRAPPQLTREFAIQIVYVVEAGLLFHSTGLNSDSKDVLARQATMIDSLLDRFLAAAEALQT